MTIKTESVSLEDARRVIAAGGAYLNNERITDPARVATYGDLLDDRYLILRRGRRTVGAVVVVPGASQPAE